MSIEDLGSELIGVARLSDLAGTASWRLSLTHEVPHHRVVVTCGGSGRCILSCIGHEIVTGDVINIPAGVVLSFPDFSSLRGLVLTVFDAALANDLPKEPNVLRATTQARGEDAQDFLHAVSLEARTADQRGKEAIAALLHELGAWMERLPEAEQDQHAPSVRLMRSFARVITEKGPKNNSVTDHAKELNVSATHLTRVTRALSGMAASAILSERRVHAIRCELENGSQPIRQIAADFGFSSPAYFTRFVARHTGMTPSRLRREARSKPDNSD